MSDLVQIPTDTNRVTNPDEEVRRSHNVPAFCKSYERSLVFLPYIRLVAKA